MLPRRRQAFFIGPGFAEFVCRILDTALNLDISRDTANKPCFCLLTETLFLVQRTSIDILLTVSVLFFQPISSPVHKAGCG
jgi:hypothetical protein